MATVSPSFEECIQGIGIFPFLFLSFLQFKVLGNYLGAESESYKPFSDTV